MIDEIAEDARTALCRCRFGAGGRAGPADRRAAGADRAASRTGLRGHRRRQHQARRRAGCPSALGREARAVRPRPSDRRSRALRRRGSHRRVVREAHWWCSHRRPRLRQRPAVASRRLGALCGARVAQMDALRHDQIFAAVSHLPHALAFTLVSMIAARPDGAELFSFAGAGFRDFTRIAGSSPEMWRDICVANRDVLLHEIEAFQSGAGGPRQQHPGRRCCERAAGLRDGAGRSQPLAAASVARHGQLPTLPRASGRWRRRAGDVQLPGSKSISNRTLLLAALARGRDRDPRPACVRRRSADA